MLRCSRTYRPTKRLSLLAPGLRPRQQKQPFQLPSLWFCNTNPPISTVIRPPLIRTSYRWMRIYPTQNKGIDICKRYSSLPKRIEPESAWEIDNQSQSKSLRNREGGYKTSPDSLSASANRRSENDPPWAILKDRSDVKHDIAVWGFSEPREDAHYSTPADFADSQLPDEPSSWTLDHARVVASFPGRASSSHESAPFLQRSADRQALRADRQLANQILKDKSPLSSDWRIPLKLLLASQSSSPAPPPGVERVFLPEQVLNKLIGSSNEGTWQLSLEGRCHVHVLPGSLTRGFLRSVLLKGSPVSVDIAKDYISTVWAEVASSQPDSHNSVPFVPSLTKMLGEGDEPVSRAVWADLTSRDPDREAITPRRPDQIPFPVEWSAVTFANYIDDITATQMPRNMRRHFYDTPEHHVTQNESHQHIKAVEACIKKVFLDPKYAQYFSTRALNTALSFLLSNRLLPTARSLCIAFDKAKGTFVPETFNIMLKGAAEEKDLFAYTYTLALMVRRGVRPDARSWISLLYTIESQDVRLIIMRYMKRAGLLDDDDTIERAVATLVKHSFATHFDDDRDFQSFVQQMDASYGKSWFGTIAANKVFSVLAERGRLDGVSEVVNLMYKRDVPMNTATLNSVLLGCRDLGSISFAIDFLREALHQFRVAPDELTYEFLFDMAWEVRLHNVCRVIWAYACLNQSTPYKMQMMVLRSLWKQPEDVPDDPWLYQAGKVIAGTGKFSTDMQYLLAPRDPPLTPPIRVSSGNDMAFPAESDPESDYRASRVVAARDIITRDLDRGVNLLPKLSMVNRLALAYDRDLEWEQMGLGSDLESTRWMVKNSVMSWARVREHVPKLRDSPATPRRFHTA